MAKRRNRGRAVDGVLVLDKPGGCTSNEILQRVKRMFGAAKAGHTGSLDPLATGVLPLCFGEATKFSQFLLDADKAYVVKAKWGERTDTADADGEVVETCATDGLTREALLSTLERFRGEIEQVPSMYSALKHNGQPLYKLARQGVEVERKARKVHIHSLELLDFDTTHFSLAVACSKGTYVRNLVEDVAAALGNLAHVVELRRTQAGPYTLEQAVTIDELSQAIDSGGHKALDELLLPLGTSADHWPALALTEATAFYLRNGNPVQIPGSPAEGWVKLTGPNEEFIGVGEVLDDGKVAPRRLISSSQ
ncbi:tRNA pseudouridine(55) synthase TruB [Ketobacter sp.]|uniref:tRNA pseudouridine(55) synthase TruB n=1 Tax=Ketobacter sp. TaxID=2083498 RepID=UPI000F0FCCCE|nr:tRNA pseudouridine(55) synthase TruB [Ketobacter sp.]RLT99372.1 MAG: tRNA pseudouridine(55) synthase TruB [Ketobacter sp.]